MVEDAHRDLDGERIGQIRQRVAVDHDREAGLDRRAPGERARRRELFLGERVVLRREHREERRIDHAAAVEHAVLLGFALRRARRHREAARALRRRHGVVGGVSLKLRIATRSIDSPSAGRSIVAAVGFTSAMAGAEIGS